MFVAEMPKLSLRLERAETSRLAWAFGLSLAAHLLVFGTYEAGKKFQVWQNLHWPAWLRSAQMLTEVLKKKEVTPLAAQQAQVPLMFVDVSPAQAVAEPPKNAKFYSDRSSVAANPEANKDSDMPKIMGKQTEIVRTRDVPKEKFVPLQPSPAPQPPQEAQEEQKPKPAYTPGDLTMARPEDKPRKDEGEAKEAKPSRPRTVREALARMQNSGLAGEKLKQEGGVKRRALEPGFDVAASPFGAYDRALIEAIQYRWYSLLDRHDYASDSRGKVVLQFHLHYDGRVTDMKVAENNVGELLCLLCQKAVMDPAPFSAWPSDMRRLLGNTRSIQFTFYYY
jgi:outer membrane biosynthesis protein TonB